MTTAVYHIDHATRWCAPGVVVHPPKSKNGAGNEGLRPVKGVLAVNRSRAHRSRAVNSGEVLLVEISSLDKSC
jgi:hypothetical protein